MECFFVGVMMLGMVVLAAVLLGIRDANEQRAIDEQRPLDERIKEIADGAALLVQQFEQMAQRANLKERDREWLGNAIAYHRQLAELASKAGCTPEEVLVFAEEASIYERKQPWTGFIVSIQARKLAALLQQQQRPK